MTDFALLDLDQLPRVALQFMFGRLLDEIEIYGSADLATVQKVWHQSIQAGFHDATHEVTP